MQCQNEKLMEAVMDGGERYVKTDCACVWEVKV